MTIRLEDIPREIIEEIEAAFPGADYSQYDSGNDVSDHMRMISFSVRKPLVGKMSYFEIATLDEKVATSSTHYLRDIFKVRLRGASPVLIIAVIRIPDMLCDRVFGVE